MNLTRQERWILSNQYEILNKLYDDGRFDQALEALRSGYEAEYESLATHIIEDDTLSASECDEVVQIMTMYSALQGSYNALTDKSGIEEHRVEFLGFDGNNEGAQLGYAEYLMKGYRFENLGRPGGINSHMPTLNAYRRMLAVHKRLGNRKLHLSKEEILEVTAAWALPE